MKGLPRYWIHRHGAYYYRPPVRYAHLFQQQWVKLGRTLQDAHRAFADLPVHADIDVYFTRDLADLYQRREVPKYPAGTQSNKLRSLTEIRRAFGHIPVRAIEPTHCYQYFEAKDGTRSARAVIEDLRHLFTKAVEWGHLKRHPIKGQVVLKKNRPRTRYVTDEELLKFRAMANKKLQAYIDLKLLTGLSKQDLLCLDRKDIQQDGIHAHRRKVRGKPKVYQWDEQGILRDVLRRIQEAHRGHIGCSRVFHTREGKPYYETDEHGRSLGKPTSFDSMWQRLMGKWVKAGGERFTEHDLRAKAASDTTLAHAQLLMDHAAPGITERVYRRAPTVVKIRGEVE